MTSILNLKEGFTPYGKGELSLARSRVFSGGEVDVKVSGSISVTVLITTRLNSSNDLMELLMVSDALERLGAERIHVFFPYLPYARQDRVMAPGEALSLKVFAKIVNAQGYRSVTFMNAHSDVSTALIDRCENLSQLSLVQKVLEGKGDYLIVSPDAGAEKKAAKIHTELKHSRGLVLCTKSRATTGEITRTNVSSGNLEGKDVYILDDICDGGKTFISLAKELKERNAGRVYLIVSHGIFSYGEDVLRDGGIDHVYTTDSITSQGSAFVTRIKLEELVPVHRTQQQHTEH